VVERSHGSRWVIWGISPRAGTVAVQRRQGRSWKTIFSLHLTARGIINRTITLGSRATFRAQVGGETSYSWSGG
jgi:hypothetical protein